MTYDVVIVGAGPSGSLLGYLLAQSKYKVAIIDKEEFPRNKVCGGGISNKTVNLLSKYFNDISSIFQFEIQGAYLTYKNEAKGAIVIDLGKRGGATILRSEFDYFLLTKARLEGAEFYPKCVFKSLNKRGGYYDVITSLDSIQTKYLVGADGVYSQVRNKLFGKDIITYKPSVEALVYVDESEIEKYKKRTLLDFGGMPRGYGWIFPKKDHLNVGIYSIYGSKGNINQDLAKFMKYYTTIQRSKRIEYRGFSIPIRNEKNMYEKDNVWLVGDAAGCAESMYGEGIYYALKSAEVAAKAFIDADKRPESNLYTKYLESDLLNDMRYSEKIAKLFYSMQWFGFHQMVRNVEINYYYSELIAGNVNYQQCYEETKRRFPAWLFSKKFPYTRINL
jgi:geranylgeranyl reductase family protein